MSHFNDIASEWDTTEKVSSMKNLAAKLKERLNLEKNLNILDYGCGTGLLGLEFEEFAKNIVGIDISKGMLDEFTRKTKNKENISSFCGELEDFRAPFSFDLIVTSMAFHHLENPLESLKQLKSLLNERGQIVIIDLDKEDGSFHPDDRKAGVFHSGFAKEELERWAEETKMNLSYSIINSICKNDREYPQFCAEFKQ